MNHFPAETLKESSIINFQNIYISICSAKNIAKGDYELDKLRNQRQIVTEPDTSTNHFDIAPSRCLKMIVKDALGNVMIGFEKTTLTWLQSIPCQAILTGPVVSINGILFLDESNCRPFYGTNQDMHHNSFEIPESLISEDTLI